MPISHGLAGNVILTNVAMNVLGKPRIALYINLARLTIFTVPFAFLGRYLAGLEGIYTGIVIGNFCAFAFARNQLNAVLKSQDIQPLTLINAGRTG